MPSLRPIDWYIASTHLHDADLCLFLQHNMHLTPPCRFPCQYSIFKWYTSIYTGDIPYNYTPQQQCRPPQAITSLPCPPHVPRQTPPPRTRPAAVMRPLPSQTTRQTCSPKLRKNPSLPKRTKKQSGLLNSRSVPSSGRIGPGRRHHLCQKP